MQIVIDIPESILNTIQADEMISREQLAVLQMHILNGTPLPKGHGKLLDEKEVYKKFYCRCLAKVAKEVLDETSTIIEADTESEEQI